jgi:hypothetical protein
MQWQFSRVSRAGVVKLQAGPIECLQNLEHEDEPEHDRGRPSGSRRPQLFCDSLQLRRAEIERAAVGINQMRKAVPTNNG